MSSSITSAPAQQTDIVLCNVHRTTHRSPHSHESIRPTAEYTMYDAAFEHYNKELFHSCLGPCMITLQRSSAANAHVSRRSFSPRTGGNEQADGIVLNPDTFQGRDDKSILSDLVHAMAILLAQRRSETTSAGDRGYRNKVWVALMLHIGLIPISHDKGRKMTGRNVTHEILAGGAFDVATDQLFATGFRLNWQSTAYDSCVSPEGNVSVNERKQRKLKQKYTCPNCAQNAWAKPNARLICGYCKQSMEWQPPR